MRLDLNLVEVFCCVYDERSFSRAAAKLRISQSTVSGHIKHLEEYLDVKLFDRLPRRVVPTRAGQLLYQRGCVILKEKEAALQDLQRLLHRREGSLLISGSPIPGECILPPMMTSFRARYSAVRVELRIADPAVVCREVLDGEAELGFSCAKTDVAGIDYRLFAQDELALVVPNIKKWQRVKAISLERLAQEPFLAREAGSGMRLLVEEKLGRTLDGFNIVGSFGSNSALKESLRVGMGVSLVSLLSVRREIAQGELKKVEIEGVGAQNFDLFAVVNPKLTLSPIAEAFLDHGLNALAREENPA